MISVLSIIDTIQVLLNSLVRIGSLNQEQPDSES